MKRSNLILLTGLTISHPDLLTYRPNENFFPKGKSFALRISCKKLAKDDILLCVPSSEQIF